MANRFGPPPIEIPPDDVERTVVAGVDFLDGATGRTVVPKGMKGIALRPWLKLDPPTCIVWFDNGEKVEADTTEVFLIRKGS